MVNMFTSSANTKIKLVKEDDAIQRAVLDAEQLVETPRDPPSRSG